MKEKYYEFYDLNDKPIKGKNAGLRWCKQLNNNRSKKIVKQEYSWLGFWVSTVWLGLNHRFDEGKPLIYETMVFRGGWRELDMERYSTRKEAKKGHEEMVGRWSNPMYVIKKAIEHAVFKIKYHHPFFK